MGCDDCVDCCFVVYVDDCGGFVLVVFEQISCCGVFVGYGWIGCDCMYMGGEFGSLQGVVIIVEMLGVVEVQFCCIG